MATQTLTKPKTDLATPWQVVVFDDPVNMMHYVTDVFMQVFGYAKAKAEKHMLEVHEAGKSIVWSGKREKAEHYVSQLLSFQLKATLQQDK